MDKNLKYCIERLKEIRNEKNEIEKARLISVYVTVINEIEVEPEEIDDILTMVAYDLDYYNPDKVERDKLGGFFDESKVAQIINDTLSKIDKILHQSK